MNKNIEKKENEKRVKGKKESFWGFLCPCLCAKKSQSEKGNYEKESQGRQQFEQQHTQNDSDVHQSTQSNLPVHFKTSQFQTHKPQVVRLQRQEDNIKIKNKYQKNKEQKLITFNIKRNNNMGGYLIDNNNNKSVSNRPEGKQNSLPSINNKNQPLLNKQQSNFTQQNRLTSPKSTIALKSSNNGFRIIQRLNNNHITKDRQQLIGIQKRLQQMQGLGDYQFLQNWQQAYENHYPVNKLSLNKLFVMGDNKNRLLCKVSSVKLFPSASSLQRYKQSIKTKKLNQKYGNRDIEFNSQLDRYWDKRYFLFQRFDQGIKLDQQSWYSVTPQAVADYISSKVNVKETILDAFCGAGGDAIKLAMICKHVIANDIDINKINCLINNAKIYDVQNLTVSCQDFFNINQKVDAVYLAPPWGGPDYYKIESFHPQQFQPKLSKIIQKAINLSSNIFFLLPANTDVQSLASIMSQKLRNQKYFIPQTCALKLQKIYFNQRLKFVAGFYGNSQVQNEIKLTDQLKYIYDMLRDSDEGIFKHKKLIRKIRQQHGMVNLLNWVFQCENDHGQLIKIQQQLSQQTLIERFQQFLLNKNLIDQKSLQKIKAQQQAQYQYELKNRQNKSRKQKEKKIQKHKQKQLRQSSLNLSSSHVQNIQKNENNQQQICEQDLANNFATNMPIIEKINFNKKLNEINVKQLNQTIKSRISSQGCIQQSQQVPQARDSMRTVSIASQFHQDQLHNITYDRMTTQSDISIKDSIQQFNRYDSLDISVEESYRINKEENNQKYFFSNQKPSNKEQNELKIDERIQRFSSPAVLSPRENFKMKKVKGTGPKWEKGIVEELNQDSNN